LILQSELILPELPVASGDIDATIRFGTVPFAPVAVTPAGTKFRIDSAGARLFYEGAAAFLVRAGREIVIEPDPAADERVVRLLLQGPVLAVLLHQRGALVLHASAVAFAGGATLFLGASGAGKSSLAATLDSRGYGVLSDDVVAVDFKGRPTVHGGVGYLKLWPDSASALRADSMGILLRDGIAKRGWLRPSRADGALPVDRAYVLDVATTCSAARLTPSAAFTELVRHSYVAPLFTEGGLGPRHFAQCAALASSGLVWRLGYRRQLDELPQVAAFISAESRAHGVAAALVC
jgi:hypothetical protein